MGNDLQLDSLKVVLLAQLLAESMDSVRGTELYKGKIKQTGNMLGNLLTPMLNKQITNVYKTDPELTTNLFNQLDELVEKLAKLNVVDLTMINQITDHYSKFPEHWQEFFAIEMVKLED